MKRGIWFIILFFLLTFLAVLPPKDDRDTGFHSSELQLQNIEYENCTVSVYTDDTGMITKPANVGYSILVKSKDSDGKVILERYFETKKNRTYAELAALDEKSLEECLIPKEQWGKQYGLSREYDQAGDCISYTYLDREQNPLDIVWGLGTVRQEYDQYHRKVKEMYYSVSGEPATNSDKVWGQKFTYYATDEAAMGETDAESTNVGKLVETVTYLDRHGEVFEAPAGYAGIKRFYDKDKRVIRELYYDGEGQQKADKQGIFGQEYIYDNLGRKEKYIFLDKNRKPMLSNKGYSCIVKSYFKSNGVKTEMYFLPDGSPAVLSHGESGIYNKKSVPQFLNAKGKVIPVPDNYLRGNPVLVIGFAVLIWAVSSRLSKRWNTLLLAAYVIFILYMTLLNREFHEDTVRYGFLETVVNMLKIYSTRVQVIENIYLFLPFGIILYYLTGRRYVVIVGVLFSVLIEVTQYVTHLGSGEVMDVVTNGLGTAAGCLLGKYRMRDRE